MNHLSLFAGSGIGTLAAAACGIRTIAHAENDPACCYCLERLWPDARLFRDVRDVTAESVADLGPIDIISGGFPCTDISTAGKGAGLGTEENPTRSGLWFEFARVIREVRPRYILAENVPALRVRGGDRVCFDLEAMGYSWESVVVGAWAVGAPHKRDRVWIVARRMDDAASPRHQGRSVGEAGQRPETPGPVPSVRREESGGGRLANPDSDERKRQRLPAAERRERDSDTDRANRGGIDACELGHPASDDQRRAPVAAMHGEGESVGGSSGGGATEHRDACKLFRWELAVAGKLGTERYNCICDVANAERDGHQGGEPASGAAPGVRRRSSEPGCCQLAIPAVQRRQEPGAMHAGAPAATEARSATTRWPSRPGEPQHPWEAPRLVEFGVGDATDGLSRRVRSRANKAALRMVGNAWCYPVAEMMFRAIVELDNNGK